MNFISKPALAVVMAAALVAPAMSAQSVENQYFPYPVVPDNLTTLTERSNFFLENFWNRCNFKTAFSSMKKMEKSFNDFTTFMPYADAATVHTSIEKLIKSVEKNPKQLLAIAEMAEGALYSDTASVVCDECYLPFAQAVASNKKISKAEKARFEYQARALAGSQVGMEAPDFTYITPDGATGKLSDIAAGAYVLLFINDPDCDECELARVRLAADPNLNDFINKNLIKVVSIYPNEPNDEWRGKTDTYNKQWLVGACANIDELYDMRRPPVIYYLNGKHEILSKTFNIDNQLEAFRVVNNKMAAKAANNN